MADPYPVQLDVTYPEGPRNRLTVLVRIILVIPIAIVLALLTGQTSSEVDGGDAAAVAGGIIFLPTLLLLVFRQRYPRWWFDFNAQLYAFIIRVSMYALLLRDEYPSTEDRQALDLRIPYPDATRLSRWLPLVKWLFAVPHYIALAVLWLVVLIAVVIAWFAILITGRCPRGIHDLVVGVLRWNARVWCYAFLLTTDRYPPFRLAA